MRQSDISVVPAIHNKQVISVLVAGMTLECVVETGFSGGLMIPLSTFESLGLLAGLVPEEYLVVMPDSRKVALYTASEEVVSGQASGLSCPACTTVEDP